MNGEEKENGEEVGYNQTNVHQAYLSHSEEWLQIKIVS